MPEEEKQEVEKDDIKNNEDNVSSGTNAFIGVMKTILFIFAIII
jgi:hypothetical protein